MRSPRTKLNRTKSKLATLSRSRKTPAAKTKSNGSAPSRSPFFPIVGVGASAGGLEAFTHLLNHLPSSSGMALVLVQHLAPKHESALTDLLSRTTNIPVTEVVDRVAVKPDHIYVIPPNTGMVLHDGILRLVPREAGTIHLPIDVFFTSLAQQRGSNAIGVILSGTASDGTEGMKAIKAQGGTTFAQDEQSAKYSDMPRNAVAAGCVDFVLPPEEIALELARITQDHARLKAPQELEANSAPENGNDLVKVFALLKGASRVDFTHYKRSTIARRLKRRMALSRTHSLKAYSKFLIDHPAELDALFQDVVIHVTGFFRDPAAFDALKQTVFPRLMKDRPPNTPVRIWVPGCSTGEEAYSIAMLLTEYLGEAPGHAPGIQIFATDISDAALENARTGLYSEKITTQVSPERLRRFFAHTTKGYQISQTIRDMCVFAHQDIINDTPFSKLDLISCRNLLIYLGRVLQQKVIPVFHYALKPDGFLFLGVSETITYYPDFFTLIDKKNKIYAKKANTTHLSKHFAGLAFAPERAVGTPQIEPNNAGYDVRKEADRILLSRYVPAGVVVNSDLQILQFHGRTSRYLEPAPGQASLSLTKMAREGMLLDLRAAIQKARKDDAPVRKHAVHVRVNGEFKAIDIEVVPFNGTSAADRYFLILFKEPSSGAKPAKPDGKAETSSAGQRAEQRQIQRLSEELAETKSNLQSIIEEQESANEELNSANEEILSSNEELQSTNEELETAKEELQSTNEELTTLNEELQNRNSELNVLNNDLVNLLSIAQIPLLILGRDLRIRRFTPQAEKMLNLIPSDIGRPIGNIKTSFNFANFETSVSRCIQTGTPSEREVQDRRGRWFTVRIRPYKTTDNKTDGAVVTWNDINAFKVGLDERYESLLRRNLAGTFRSTVSGRFLECNEAFARIVGCKTPGEVLRHRTSDFYYSTSDQDKFVAQLKKKSIPINTELIYRRNDGTPATVLVNAMLVPSAEEPNGVIEAIVLDISERKEAQGLHQNLGRLLALQDEERRRFSRELHDSISSTMTGLMANLAQVAKSSDRLDRKEHEAVQESLKLAKECSAEIRTISYLLHPPLLDELGLASALRWLCEGFSKRSGVECTVNLPHKLQRMPAEVEQALFRIAQEGLTNIHRHSKSPVARIRLVPDSKEVILELRDEGRGMRRDGKGPKGKQAGEGVGILGMRERLKQLGGKLEIDSSKSGTTIRAILPLAKPVAANAVVAKRR